LIRPINFGTVFVEPDYYAVLTDATLDVSAAFGLLLNDYATLGGLTALSFTQPAHGTVSVSSDGSFIYTPDSGYVGLDTFTYTAGAGIESATATVTVDVFQPLLVATPDVYTVHTGDTLIVTGPNNLLGNDFTNGGSIDATSFSSPSHGMLSVSLTGDITYVPDPGFIGDDTFTYYISNGYGTAFAVDTIDVVGAPPVASPDNYTVQAGDTLLVDAQTGLLANDLAFGGTVDATSFSSPSHGMLSVSITGALTYVPDPGFVGTDSFTYYISDGTETSYAVATIDVVDQAPIANPDFYHVAENGTLIVTGAKNLLGNDFVNGGTIDATSFSSPSHGMLSVSITGDITYVPDHNYVGTDSFTYYISDGTQTSYAVATILVGQSGVFAEPDYYSDLEGQTLIVTGPNNLLGNDFANSGSVVATSFSSPSHGMLSVSITGDITYVPDPGFIGTDTFTYYISNGTGTAFAVDTIDVAAPLLVATPDVYTVHTGDTLIVTGPNNLLGNDFTNSGSIDATSFSSPSHGMLSVSLTGDITYVPDPGYIGTDTFTYYISNGYGTAFAVDTIDVVGAPPIANPETYTVQAGQTLLVDAQTGLLANDLAFGGTVDATSFSSPSHGMLSVSITGALTYVPDPGFVGTDSFTYYISDGTQTAYAVDTINVVDQAPVANPDFYYVTENGSLVVTGSHNLLGNDFVNGGSIDATSFSSPSHGMLSVSITGDITYVPDQNYVGADSFTYYISDGTQTSYAVATIEVIACFAAGTRVLTDRGEMPIESLGVGDRVVTLTGAVEPIVWVGRRILDCARHPKPHDVWPVRIAPGAFGPGQPRRALLLSPDHSIYAEGVLIPVKYLIDGAGIVQERRDRIAYHHIELARHNVVLAEGLPAETLLPGSGAGMFDNAAGPIALHPDLATLNWEAAGYAPLVVTGSPLEAVRRRLSQRAAYHPASQPPSTTISLPVVKPAASLAR
jgi:LysM repeat protein